MTDIQALIDEHRITATPVYVDSFNGSPTGALEHDVYDVLLTIAYDLNPYGGDDNPRRRTYLVRGFGVSYNDSMPQNGGDLVPPTVVDVLESLLLSVSATVRSYDNAQEWAADMNIVRNAKKEWADLTDEAARLCKFFGGSGVLDDFLNAL